MGIALDAPRARDRPALEEVPGNRVDPGPRKVHPLDAVCIEILEERMVEPDREQHLTADGAVEVAGRSDGDDVGIRDRGADLLRRPRRPTCSGSASGAVLQRVQTALWDADNHYYEARDCFTRYLEPQFADRGVQPRVDADGRESIVVDGGRSRSCRSPSATR